MTGTVRELLNFFEKYYGERYSGKFLDAMIGYLDGYSDEFCKAAAEVMIKRFSRSYGKSPCPADIERHMDEILAAMPRREYLPEPDQEMTHSERMETLGRLLDETKRLLSTGKTEPMTRTLTNLCGDYETKIREGGRR